MIEVTMREWVMLTFIRHYIKRYGRSPTHAEISKGCGWNHRDSPSIYLLRLAGKGVVTLKHKESRGIVLRNVTVGVDVKVKA